MVQTLPLIPSFFSLFSRRSAVQAEKNNLRFFPQRLIVCVTSADFNGQPVFLRQLHGRRRGPRYIKVRGVLKSVANACSNPLIFIGF